MFVAKRWKISFFSGPTERNEVAAFEFLIAIQFALLFVATIGVLSMRTAYTTHEVMEVR